MASVKRRTGLPTYRIRLNNAEVVALKRALNVAIGHVPTDSGRESYERDRKLMLQIADLLQKEGVIVCG